MGVEGQKELRATIIFAPLFPAIFIPIHLNILLGGSSMFPLIFFIATTLSYLTVLVFSVPMYIIVWKIGYFNIWSSIVVGLLSAIGVTWIMALNVRAPNVDWWYYSWSMYVSFTAPCGIIGGIAFWFLGIWKPFPHSNPQD